jgi:hypothetical protein
MKSFLSSLLFLGLIAAIPPRVNLPDVYSRPLSDTLPAGTRVNISIRQPGETLSNEISVIIPGPVQLLPAPVVTTGPVIIEPVRDAGRLYEGDVIGTRDGHALIVRSVDGKLFLTEDVGSGNFLFRGTNLLIQPGVETTKAPLRGQLSGGETKFGGLSEPPGVGPPSGYVRKEYPDGAVYYGPAQIINTAPAQPTLPGVPLDALTYQTEPAGQFNPGQFGRDRYYSPDFIFSVDFDTDRSLDERRAVGENRLQISSLSFAQREQLRAGEAIYYYTESTLHGELEGSNYYLKSLPEFYREIYPRIIYAGQPGADQAVGIVVLNIETSNYWGKGSYTGRNHWPTWESVKYTRIQCEFDGQWRTLEELDNQGLMAVEESVRRGNRLALEMAMIRERANPAVKLLLSYGASGYQGQANLMYYGVSQPFLASSPNVSNIGGDRDGHIRLQRPDGGYQAYTLTGTQYQNEDIMTGYYYRFTYDLKPEGLDIWRNPKGKTYADLWAAQKPVAIVADEKAYLDMNEEMMVRLYGKAHGILRLFEPVFEDNMATYVNGSQESMAARTPYPQQLTEAVRSANYRDVPKIWQAPYLFYSRYAVTRFWAGERPGYGIHVFPAGKTKLESSGWYDQLLHPYSQLYQARADLAGLESWYAGSVFIKNPEVQTNMTGEFKALTGPQAYGYSDGTLAPAKLAAMLRYKDNDDGSETVYILAGYGQDYQKTSPHAVRGPRGNTFELTLTGPSAQLFHFEIPPGRTGKTYSASGQTAPDGYGGRVQLNLN